jgi:hypothetical protein
LVVSSTGLPQCMHRSCIISVICPFSFKTQRRSKICTVADPGPPHQPERPQDSFNHPAGCRLTCCHQPLSLGDSVCSQFAVPACWSPNRKLHNCPPLRICRPHIPHNRSLFSIPSSHLQNSKTSASSVRVCKRQRCLQIISAFHRTIFLRCFFSNRPPNVPLTPYPGRFCK